MEILNREEKFMEMAIALARQGMQSGKGGPFGCVIVRVDEVVGRGCNEVLAKLDPTAHAEVVAIRDACKNIGNFQLDDCEVYTSCEPCPMCLGALYWARVKKVVYANTRYDAAAIEFDDDFIYQEINTSFIHRKIPFVHLPHPDAIEVFRQWKEMESKLRY
ncbi:MAG TPA: nucleoside deaminase [Acidobacteriota bacterium]|jgi:tRNA(Arg) A34 adenosine deaminase TadA